LKTPNPSNFLHVPVSRALVVTAHNRSPPILIRILTHCCMYSLGSTLFTIELGSRWAGIQFEGVLRSLKTH
jgi:hypothetical protein